MTPTHTTTYAPGTRVASNITNNTGTIISDDGAAGLFWVMDGRDPADPRRASRNALRAI